MLRCVIAFCLNYRLIVLMLAAGLLVWGGIAARQAPWDVFPEFAPPQIVVQTEAPGLSTEEVEQLVTVPVESAVNGVGDAAVVVRPWPVRRDRHFQGRHRRRGRATTGWRAAG